MAIIDQIGFLPQLLFGEVNSAVIGAIIGGIFAIYVYYSYAYMMIGKKAGISSPGLAWVPFVGGNLVVFFGSGMPAWPWFLFAAQYLIPFVGFLAGMVFWVYAIIWTWKTFEKVNAPGWWAILTIIPLVNLVIIGIVAWKE